MRRNHTTTSKAMLTTLVLLGSTILFGCEGTDAPMPPTPAVVQPDGPALPLGEPAPVAEETEEQIAPTGPCARRGSGAWALIEAGGDGVRCDPQSGLRLEGRIMGISAGASDGTHRLRPTAATTTAEDGRFKLQGRLGR